MTDQKLKCGLDNSIKEMYDYANTFDEICKDMAIKFQISNPDACICEECGKELNIPELTIRYGLNLAPFLCYKHLKAKNGYYIVDGEFPGYPRKLVDPKEDNNN